MYVAICIASYKLASYISVASKVVNDISQRSSHNGH